MEDRDGCLVSLYFLRSPRNWEFDVRNTLWIGREEPLSLGRLAWRSWISLLLSLTLSLTHTLSLYICVCVSLPSPLPVPLSRLLRICSFFARGEHLLVVTAAAIGVFWRHRLRGHVACFSNGWKRHGG